VTGPEFRAARHTLGWTLRDTARRLGYASDNTVREIEAGKMSLTPDRAAFVEAWMKWDARRAEWMRRNPPPPDKCVDM
jgi:transcriptional regulator with XRE-family HTH domain